MAITRYSRMNPTLDDLKRAYNIPDVKNYDRAFFTLSYLSANWMKTIPLLRRITTFNKQQSDWNNYDQIVPRVFLGRLPSKNNVTLPESVGMVVSVVEPYELSSNIMIDKYTPAELKDNNIKQLVIRIKDTTADTSICEVYNAVVEIKQFLDDHPEKDVYIHCKAGRSRSAMLLVVFLSMFGDEYGLKINNQDPESNVMESINFIADKRPHITINPDQTNMARQVTSEAKSRLFSASYHQSKREELYSSPKDYLVTLDAKDTIRGLLSFLELQIYAVEIQHMVGIKYIYDGECQRTNHIREFFNDIVNSTDGSWYDDLVNKTGPVQKLLDADTGDEGDITKRSLLVENFTQEVNNLLKQKVALTEDVRMTASR